MDRSETAGPAQAPVALGDIRAESLLYTVQLGQGIGSLRFVPELEADFRADHAQRSVSRMRTATTTPDANVIAATAQIAADTPTTSAVTPASSAQIA